MEKIFAGKNAFILGGSGGIGFALSSALLKECDTVTIHGGSDSAKFNSLVQDAGQYNTHCSKLVCPLDAKYMLSDENKAIDILQKEAGKADILCLCYGPFVQKKLHETTCDDWAKISQLNFMLSGILISTALSYMMTKRWGRILLFGGTHTTEIQGFKTNAAYASAKTALAVLTKSVALEYAPYGITCNLISPGFTDTEYIDDTLKHELRQKMPAKDLIAPKTIAQAGLFLLQNYEVNGALLNIDAGWNAQGTQKDLT